MFDYRDDTLSFDRYEVQEPEPHKVQGVPSVCPVCGSAIQYLYEDIHLAYAHSVSDAKVRDILLGR